jgi:hypothetical protein
VTTDTGGAYQIAVEPGRYWIRAEREGYLSTYFGQSAPHDVARSVYVEAGQPRKEVDLLLGRASVVAGRVLDDLGEPVEGAAVIAAAADLHAARTNDLGEFRIPRVEPGQYLVWAMPPHPGTRIDQTIFVPTYALGTGDARMAVPLTVPPSAVATVDISLLRGNPAEVEGIVLNGSGSPVAAAEVSLTLEWSGRIGGHRFDVANTSTGSDGRFVLKRVPPGNYRLKATSGREHGEANVTVGDEGVRGLIITATPGATIVGHVSIRSAGDRVCRSPVVTAGRVDSQAWDERTGSRVRTDERGGFRLEGLYGQQRLSVGCPQPTIVTQLLVKGTQVDADVIDTASLGALAEVEIVASLAGGSAHGVVKDREGRSCDCIVLAVRDDPALWLPPHQFLWASPAQNGTFEFPALPPGSYFAVVEPLGKTRWDSEYLRVARERGTAFRSDGQSSVGLDLTCR